ncbi:hypothetical protein F4811DRAFT_531154 [Daldinia bambusicola]|nr:hypothetical protein F4811DRAFT_531154 [Daldinia bambusicola]
MMPDFLDKAEADLKRAKDAIFLKFPQSNMVIKARIRPTQRFIQLDMNHQTCDDFGLLDPWN